MTSILKRVATLAAVAIGFGVPVSSASASHLGMSVTLGSPIQLVSGVYMDVPVQVTCSPFDVPATTFGVNEVLSVSVTQRTGTSIARGFGSVWGGPALLTCDGLPHSYDVSVFPMAGPFHGGRVVVSASASISWYDWSIGQAEWNTADTGLVSTTVRGG
jgi:hypothetical protein